MLCSECQYIFLPYERNGKEIKASGYFEKLRNMFALAVLKTSLNTNQRKKMQAPPATPVHLRRRAFFRGGKASVSALETYFDCPRKLLYSLRLFCVSPQRQHAEKMS
jgi:hypothetical protein